VCLQRHLLQAALILCLPAVAALAALVVVRVVLQGGLNVLLRKFYNQGLLHIGLIGCLSCHRGGVVAPLLLGLDVN
jgi:hypothetical protein